MTHNPKQRRNEQHRRRMLEARTNLGDVILRQFEFITEQRMAPFKKALLDIKDVLEDESVEDGLACSEIQAIVDEALKR